MKRITVRCPLVLNMGPQQFEFKPAQSYEVEDAVAAHPYLQAHLATYIDITPPAKEKAVEAEVEEPAEEPVEEKAEPVLKEKPAPKKNAKKTATVKEAENVKPASDA